MACSASEEEIENVKSLGHMDGHRTHFYQKCSGELKLHETCNLFDLTLGACSNLNFRCSISTFCELISFLDSSNALLALAKEVIEL